jgi:hypothetical protein
MCDTHHSDTYYIGYIKKTKFLKPVTKKAYTRRLKTITDDIYTESLETILHNPVKFEKKLIKYCETTKNSSGNPLSLHTVGSYFTSVIALFMYNQQLKEDCFELFNKWKKIHEKYRKPIQNQYKSNEPTERQKEAYVSFEDVCRAAQEQEIGSQERLLLMMYTEIPPLRSDFYKTKIYDTNPRKKSENYIVMSEDDNTAKLYLNKYKTSKRYGTIEALLPEKLVTEIRASLEAIPREYLFVSPRSKRPFDKENTFNKWANRVLKRIFNDKFTLSMLRHIFITRRDLQMESKSGLEQEKLARQMGHSIEQQRQYMWHIWVQEQEGLEQKGSGQKNFEQKDSEQKGSGQKNFEQKGSESDIEK